MPDGNIRTYHRIESVQHIYGRDEYITYVTVVSYTNKEDALYNNWNASCRTLIRLDYIDGITLNRLYEEVMKSPDFKDYRR